MIIVGANTPNANGYNTIIIGITIEPSMKIKSASNTIFVFSLHPGLFGLNNAPSLIHIFKKIKFHSIF